MKAKSGVTILLLGFVFLLATATSAAAAQIHRAGTGENLGQIAAQYDTDVEALLRLNPFMEDPDHVAPGQVVVVPEVVVAAPGGEQQPGDGPVVRGEVKTAPAPASLPTISQVRRAYPADFVVSGPSTAKRVALTFDDGPDARYTPAVLDILRDENVPATFFVVGNLIDRYPQVVERIQAEGHVIGSHSWSHANLRELTPAAALLELQRAEGAIFGRTGHLPALFRAPYGAVNMENMQLLVARGCKNIFWTADSLDWDLKDPDQVLVHTLTGTRRGAIILMHSAGGRDQNLDAGLAALPDLIYTLRAQGYEFVTVDELLSIPAYRNQSSGDGS